MKQFKHFVIFISSCFSVLAFGETKIAPKDLALHNKPTDCWMAIDGFVYNVTPTLEDHFRRYEYALDSWCGKEATQAWKTKDSGKKPHSRKANLMLKNLMVGVLVP